MARIFLPLQVDFDDDEKVLRLTRYGKDARGLRDLLVGAWRYCKRERSDGNVPTEAIGKLVYPDTLKNGIRDADRLVEVGIAERTPTGYLFPGFLKHNKSKAQLEAEAIKKAEAGKKGGEASGLSRKVEADTKQSASPVVRVREAIDKDKDIDRDKVRSSVEGERPETLRAVPATQPPEKPTSSCTRHPYGNPTNEPCGGCKRDAEQKTREADRLAEKRRLVDEELARNCLECEGTHKVLDPETKLPTRKTCEHRNVRRAAS